MKSIFKKTLLGTALGLVLVTHAHAWTQAECANDGYRTADCQQYKPPTPTPTPTPTTLDNKVTTSSDAAATANGGTGYGGNTGPITVTPTSTNTANNTAKANATGGGGGTATGYGGSTGPVTVTPTNTANNAATGYGGNVGPINASQKTDSSATANGGTVGPISLNPNIKTDVGATANGGIGGGATLKGDVSGTNSGTFTNDGKQSQSVGIGPVNSGSTSSLTGSGNSTNKLDTSANADVRVDSKGGAGGAVSGSGNSSSSTSSNSSSAGGAGGAVKDVGNGNGSGNKTAATATGNGAGNSTSYNDSSKTTYKQVSVPVMFNPVPPSMSSTSLMTKETFTCGPLQQVIKTRVDGKQVGTFTDTIVYLGEDYELGPIMDKNGEQIYYKEKIFIENGEQILRRFGTQASIVTALPNVSGASSFSLGFAGTGGGGSGGVGSSSAMQRIVTKITLADCELPGAYKLVQVVAPAVAPVSRGELNNAINALANLRYTAEVPTERVVKERVPCKMEEFTDASGKKLTMCRGPQSGSYLKSRIVPETVRITGAVESSGTARSKGKND